MRRSDYEPSADMRAVAKTCFDMFQALLQEGFTEKQALTVLAEAMRASIQNQQPPP